MSETPETVAIPLVEEELKIHRREIETGRVRIRTVPDERTQVVSESLQHSEADVERVFIDREVSEVPPIREEGDAVIVPVLEERLVKRLFLVEEVRVTRRVFTEQLQESIQLRSQQVIVERQEGSGHPVRQDRSEP